MKFISNVNSFAALTREISCSTREINFIFLEQVHDICLFYNG